MIIGYFERPKIRANRPDGLRRTHVGGNVTGAGSLELRYFIRQNEPLEHFIGEHGAARREANEIFTTVQKSIVDQLCNRAAEVLDGLFAEAGGQVPQADP